MAPVLQQAPRFEYFLGQAHIHYALFSNIHRLRGKGNNMKILDAGTENLSNQDVLQWIKRKREQHAAEDAEDKKKGNRLSKRPQNFLQGLERHERELTSTKYPYKRNPSAYDGTYAAMERFDALLAERIAVPLEENYRGQGMSVEQLEKTLGREQEEKSLTETEHLMIMNLAPTSVEQLQPMIENADDRFTAEELQLIVDTVVEVYRPEEPKAPVMEEEVEAGAEEGMT